jgi:hypothetical protein
MKVVPAAHIASHGALVTLHFLPGSQHWQVSMIGDELNYKPAIAVADQVGTRAPNVVPLGVGEGNGYVLQYSHLLQSGADLQRSVRLSDGGAFLGVGKSGRVEVWRGSGDGSGSGGGGCGGGGSGGGGSREVCLTWP